MTKLAGKAWTVAPLATGVDLKDETGYRGSGWLGGRGGRAAGCQRRRKSS
jgi:hypothetical protein